MLRSVVLVLAAMATAALAEVPQTDGVAAGGLLSDMDLYRLATCGAPPGGDCKSKPLRWGKTDLTLRVDLGTHPLPKGFEARLNAALTNALAEVNGAGSAIRIRQTNAPTADILLRPTPLGEGATLIETPGFSGPGIMGVGYMTVWSDQSGTIAESVILISTEITDADLPSVMLEEVTQSLGFLYDVDGPAYEGVSILSQTSNETTTLAGQDATLLRLHYPLP
jgi:Protein of unknown function (DUF2927)